MKLRVVQLGPVPPPEGGVSRNVFAIRERLLIGGDYCTVIATTKGNAGSDVDGISFPRTPIQLVKVLRSAATDITHLHLGGEITPRVLALAAAVTMFGRGKKVLTMHSGGFPSSKTGRAASPATLAAAVFRRFDHVIAVNDEIATVFRRYGVDDYRLSVVPPYVLTRPREQVEMPAEISGFTKGHTPLFVAVGGLEPEYQPLLLIDAMRYIVDEHQNAGLVIVGGGSLREHAENAILEAGLADSVLLADSIEHDVVLKLIEQADVMLRITQFDGDAISVRESLFLGTPVIASRTGLRPEGVHLIDDHEPESIAAAVSEVMSVPPRHQDAAPQADQIAAIIGLYRKLATTQDS
ncbi:MAG: glycosyltransferase family 4 protein [Acidobacteriota bacterium]|nr:MAG: glycosyltransferase family 4 protein [Acidobacteriota bacterium]